MSAGNVRVLHEVLVDDPWIGGSVCPSAGYVVPQAMKANQLSHLAIMPSLPAGKDLLTHIFTAAGTTLMANAGATTPATSSAYTTPLTVFQEWNDWSSPTAASCGATQGCY
jgi:hypothetical protein